jgi:hypothetical protein
VWKWLSAKLRDWDASFPSSYQRRLLLGHLLILQQSTALARNWICLNRNGDFGGDSVDENFAEKKRGL